MIRLLKQRKAQKKLARSMKPDPVYWERRKAAKRGWETRRG